MLYKFIEHRQLFEFIEVYKVYLRGDAKFIETPENLGGKTFLHLAVEHSATEIASYLLLDAKVDPNVLSHNAQMAVLHVAVNYERHDLIDLILMSERTDINIMSGLHGTPLHVASRMGNLKIVQQLLMHGADMSLKSQKNGKLAKHSTDNQRIVFLIEKYETLRALEQDAEDSGDDSWEEVEEDGNA
jgi:ankyrin repeat protein